MIKRALSLAGLITAAGMALNSCGGEGGIEAPADQSSIAPVQIVSAGGGKVVSGPPAGIYVTWTRSTDTRATGYYLYRNTESMPDPPPEGNLPPELRVNNGEVIPQPGSGTTVTFNDLFPVVVGEEYFYRVTVLNSDDPPQESYPSNEMSWIVHGHTVNNVTPDSAFWGDDVTIDGETFGTYNDTTDAVAFTAVGGGTVEGAVVSWEDTLVTATVPEGADTGPVFIVIDGTPAGTDNDLTILNPLIDSLDPAEGFLEQPLGIVGRNFGEQQISSKVFMNDIDISGTVTGWSDNRIDIVVPVDPGSGPVRIEVLFHPSNTLVFTPRPEIFDASPPIQSGEAVTVTGRLFGDNEGEVFLDGTELMAVTSWSADTVEATLVGTAGEHTITVTDENGLASNDYSYTIIPDLMVTLTGLSPSEVYLPEDPPAIGVETADDAELVEFLVDGEVFLFTDVAPFDSLVLPVQMMSNGTHEVSLRATRRAITAESLPIFVTVYSLIGDVNGDGLVDITDRDELEGLLGMESDDPSFLPWYDTDGDGVVTEADLSAVGYNFGDAVAAP